jgi:hypothetical protein
MMKALYLLLLVSGTALADDAAILKCRALGDSASRVNCYDAIPVGAAAAAPTAARSAAVKNPDQAFGMETVKQQIEQPKSIESTIVGNFEGWRPGAQIKLANGQVWRVIDGSEQALPRSSNQKVKIVRNMFGTLFLEIDGSNHSAKVRRVQ